MIRALLLLLAVSFGQRISGAEELSVKIGGESGEEVEVADVSGGILTVETRQPGEQMFVRQMSNGQDLLILVYTSNGQLVGCEKFQGPTPELNRFLNRHSDLISAAQQDQNGTEFNPPPIDWNRSWKECIRVQEAEKEQNGRIRRNPVAVRSRRSSVDWTVLFPGTNWCGKGDASSRGGSLYGYLEATDRCCHQHDTNCFASIEPRETKYNYNNTGITTISHCDCDAEFKSCLKGVGKNKANRIVDRIASGLVGRGYFNFLRLNCLTLEPVCVEYERSTMSWLSSFSWYSCKRYSSGVTAQIHEPTPY